MTDPEVTPKLGNQTYDLLKFIAQIVLPALATLYFAIAGLWHLSYVEQIVGTIAALDTFLGVLLGLSTKTYRKAKLRADGNFVVNKTDPTKNLYSLELDTPFDDVEKKSSIRLNVVHPR